MIIQGCSDNNRSEQLINIYKDFIKESNSADEILVIVLNPFKKSEFIKRLNKTGIETSKSNIYTLNGLYYNAFKDNTDYIKKVLKCGENDNLVQCGLEISQYIFKQCIKESDFSDYISKVNLLHQLFRRYSLIVQNCLTDKEVENRSKLLNEVFAKDAYSAIRNYKQKTIEYKSFDYLRQAAIFPVIYKNTEYFSGIKYLILDDADEMPFILWQFIDFLMPQIKDYVIAYDVNGSARCGYLCAYKSGISDFKAKYNPKNIILPNKNMFADTAEALFKAIKGGEKLNLKKFIHTDELNRLDMFNKALKDIKKLIGSGINPCEISIISPLCDEFLKEAALHNKFGIEFQIVSGNEKLSDINGIKHIISILRIVNNLEIDDYRVKSLLIDFAGIPFRKFYKNIEDIKNGEYETINYNDKSIKLGSIIKSLKNGRYGLTEQLRIIFENLFKDNIAVDDIQKYEFLLKEAKNFEQAFASEPKYNVKDFIIQIENSVISENPINAFSIQNNKVIISTPQKIIDYSINTKYQFWLDISNSEWLKQDTGTLYNAWVFNRDWNKSKYSFDENIILTRDKTARIVRKLMFFAQKGINFYSSIYDASGNENFGGISDFIQFEEAKEKKTEFNIVPREDQKPVLEYKKGKMGIMAVPGAGKTTILLALIIKLINSGISPENIFVLTYMESAAKNFKERIKANITNNSVLPNISTIHGLALRIIKENGNYSKAGLDENFNVCDDSEKEQIIKELFYKLKIDEEKYENYLKSISIVKLSKNQSELNSKYKEIQDFYNFLKEYNKTLKEKNLIDYDDMLRYSVEILENNKETAQYYQNMCRYIIEDEAQDSTQIQQELINILAAKHKNIVRCGDINQSITSTFTNSNIESFKKFISDNNKAEMTSSQRCAEPIYSLANKMIEKALSDKNQKDAFYKIKIKGTDKNPISETNPEYINFEHEKDEKLFILNRIKEIQKQEPDASIALLLRLNAQVNVYNEYFNQNGIKTLIRTDSLSQKDIYKYIYSVLKIIENPLNNNNIKDLALLYIQSEVKKNKIIKFLDDLKNPFISLNADDIDDEVLNQLYWDIDYHLNNSAKPADKMALSVGIFYSKNTIDISNTYIISAFIKRLNDSSNDSSNILSSLDYYAKKPMSAYKFFENGESDKQNTVNIMTMHKSKGGEFDYVFIPQLTEENYPLNISSVKLKSGGHFVQSIKHAAENTAIKTPEELKKEQINETLRLLYVGITRARKGLTLTYANNYTSRKNTKKSEFIYSLLNDA